MSSEPSSIYQLVLGLPAEVTQPDVYQLLGVEQFCGDKKKIGQAAVERHGMLLKWQNYHDHEAIHRLENELGEAFEVLADSDRKTAYDVELRQQLGDADPSSPAPDPPTDDAVLDPQLPDEIELDAPGNLGPVPGPSSSSADGTVEESDRPAKRVRKEKRPGPKARRKAKTEAKGSEEDIDDRLQRLLDALEPVQETGFDRETSLSRKMRKYEDEQDLPDDEPEEVDRKAPARLSKGDERRAEEEAHRRRVMLTAAGGGAGLTIVMFGLIFLIVSAVNRPEEDVADATLTTVESETDTSASDAADTPSLPASWSTIAVGDADTRILRVAISPGGKIVAVVLADELQIHRVGGSETRTIKRGIQWARFARDGSHLTFVDKSGLLGIWRPDDWDSDIDLIQGAPVLSGQITRCDYSPVDDRLAVFSEDEAAIFSLRERKWGVRYSAARENVFGSWVRNGRGQICLLGMGVSSSENRASGFRSLPITIEVHDIDTEKQMERIGDLSHLDLDYVKQFDAVFTDESLRIGLLSQRYNRAPEFTVWSRSRDLESDGSASTSSLTLPEPSCAAVTDAFLTPDGEAACLLRDEVDFIRWDHGSTTLQRFTCASAGCEKWLGVDPDGEFLAAIQSDLPGAIVVGSVADLPRETIHTRVDVDTMPLQNSDRLAIQTVQVQGVPASPGMNGVARFEIPAPLVLRVKPLVPIAETVLEPAAVDGGPERPGLGPRSLGSRGLRNEPGLLWSSSGRLLLIRRPHGTVGEQTVDRVTVFDTEPTLPARLFSAEVPNTDLLAFSPDDTVLVQFNGTELRFLDGRTGQASATIPFLLPDGQPGRALAVLHKPNDPSNTPPNEGVLFGDFGHVPSDDRWLLGIAGQNCVGLVHVHSSVLLSNSGSQTATDDIETTIQSRIHPVSDYEILNASFHREDSEAVLVAKRGDDLQAVVVDLISRRDSAPINIGDLDENPRWAMSHSASQVFVSEDDLDHVFTASSPRQVFRLLAERSGELRAATFLGEAGIVKVSQDGGLSIYAASKATGRLIVDLSGVDQSGSNEVTWTNSASSAEADATEWTSTTRADLTARLKNSQQVSVAGTRDGRWLAIAAGNDVILQSLPPELASEVLQRCRTVAQGLLRRSSNTTAAKVIPIDTTPESVELLGKSPSPVVSSVVTGASGGQILVAASGYLQGRLDLWRWLDAKYVAVSTSHVSDPIVGLDSFATNSQPDGIAAATAGGDIYVIPSISEALQKHQTTTPLQPTRTTQVVTSFTASSDGRFAAWATGVDTRVADLNAADAVYSGFPASEWDRSPVLQFALRRGRRKATDPHSLCVTHNPVQNPRTRIARVSADPGGVTPVLVNSRHASLREQTSQVAPVMLEIGSTTTVLAVVLGQNIHLYSLQDRQLPLTATLLAPELVTALAVSDNGDRLVAGTRSGRILMWLKSSLAKRKAVSPEGLNEDELLLGGDSEGGFRNPAVTRSASAGIPADNSWQAHTTEVTTITFGTSRYQIVSGSTDGSLRVWNLRTLK